MVKNAYYTQPSIVHCGTGPIPVHCYQQCTKLYLIQYALQLFPYRIPDLTNAHCGLVQILIEYKTCNKSLF